MSEPVLVESVPPPHLIDRVLADASVVVIRAPPPARGALLALAVEREKPCVVQTPVGLSESHTRRLARISAASGHRIVAFDRTRELSACVREALLPVSGGDENPGRELLRDGVAETEPNWIERAAAARSAHAADDVVDSLGWRCTPPPGWSSLPHADRDANVSLPLFEVFAYEHELKPALYLSLPAHEAERWQRHFAGHSIATLDFDLVNDGVLDRRSRTLRPAGEGSHRDIFVSRDREAVLRAKAIYEDPLGPTRGLREMGQILGYPSCCVRAFAALADRSNNAAIRWAARSRTRALDYPFESVLNNLLHHVLPWFVCTYACASSVDAAKAVLGEFALVDDDAARELRRSLARPVLYVDHARRLVFDRATVSGDALYYQGVRVAGVENQPASQAFEQSVARMFAAGERLTGLDSPTWTLSHDDLAYATIERAPRSLGDVFTFADAGKSGVRA